MKINLTDVTTESPNEWIKPIKNGDGSYQTQKFTLKVESIAQEWNKNGDECAKFVFKTSDGKTYSETFPFNKDLLWKLKRFTIAMQAPSNLDLNDLVNRYVLVTLTGRLYNGKDYNELVAWEYAPQNDKLAPIPEAKDEEAELQAEAEELF